MKALFVIAIAVLLVFSSTAAIAQWEFVRAYTPYHAPSKPDNLWGIHGVAVDPDGKIWVCPYEATDTLTIGPGTNDARREIFVFNPDGTPAAFSPVKEIEVGGVIDSLNNNNSSRGIATDQEGNILYSSFNRVFRIDYKTGLGLGKIDEAQTGSITKAATDDNGYVFVGRVINGGFPIRIFNPDLSFLANAVDTLQTGGTIARTLAVSGDGTRFYFPAIYSTPNKKTYVFENLFGPGFGQYTLVDSFFIGMQAESMGWQPRPGGSPILWASAGSMENPPDSMWQESVWYGLDPATGNVIDSIEWGVTFPGNPTFDDTVANAQRRRPRGIAFTSTGDTAYVCMFLADSNSVKMFRKTATSVEPVAGTVPEEYTLSQNYPNPFNPTTEIQFSIPTAGLTTLVVYDMLGREVVTLVNDNLTPGSYKTTFNAASVSSGTYLYILTSNGYRVSKKMMLIK